jgi:glutamine synthetase
MYTISKHTICEYIWLGGNGEIRSKTRVLPNNMKNHSIPDWNYDASSTNQAPSDGNTEGILKPVFIINDPLRFGKFHACNCLLVLCETYDVNGSPLKGNNRSDANIIFNSKLEEIPWFGLEQEYFIMFRNNNPAICSSHYCSPITQKETREIVEKHLNACIEIGLKISGLNAEVSPNQWEFQIGPCEGIVASDQLIIARYLLEKICEEHDAYVDYRPKPYLDMNGSGCHINFSTEVSRGENGLPFLYTYIKNLERNHKITLSHYGENNHLRLTGLHETSSFDTFSHGIGTRNTSIRIPNQVVKENCGYLEDRRPAANIDPYEATSAMFKTIFPDYPQITIIKI